MFELHLHTLPLQPPVGAEVTSKYVQFSVLAPPHPKVTEIYNIILLSTSLDIEH